MITKRLTIDYGAEIFAFLKATRVATVGEAEYIPWLERQLNIFLQKKADNIIDSSVRKEFFYVADFLEAAPNSPAVKGASVLKLGQRDVAQAKSIVADPQDSGKHKIIRDLVRAMEKHCSINSYRILELHVNDEDESAQVVRENPAYSLVSTYSPHTGPDEFLYRRRLSPDYLGDPMNLRDISLWYLESFLSDSLRVLTKPTGQNPQGNHSFSSNKYDYLCGPNAPTENDQYSFEVLENDRTGSGGEKVLLKACAIIKYEECKEPDVKTILNSTNVDNYEIVFLFVKEYQETKLYRGVKIITWQEMMKRVTETRMQHYVDLNN